MQLCFYCLSSVFIDFVKRCSLRVVRGCVQFQFPQHLVLIVRVEACSFRVNTGLRIFIYFCNPNEVTGIFTGAVFSKIP